MTKIVKPTWRVLIGSRSFGQSDPTHLTQLQAAGCEIIPNTVGRGYRAAELLVALQGIDAIITGTDELTADVINAADRLKTIAKHGVGLDNIDLAAARARNISVTATPGAIHDAVADLTLGLLLALIRQIVPAHQSVQAGQWKRFIGYELRGKTLGIVGLGRIGKEVCLRAQAFGMKVIAYDLYPDQAFAAQQGVVFATLDELLATADVVSLHAPPTSDDKPLLDTIALTRMKPSAYLINTARGQLVDEAALATALASGQLAGAGLDVFVDEPPKASPLLGLENVVLTSHIAGQTYEGQRRMGDITLENCLRALRGEQPLYQV
ncbi:MAG: phosphoglycerate dehydrogenase [Chloroflexota bacterium]|nr:phosphoglycerate dehydrogenase [Chloroflexota bacterium]